MSELPSFTAIDHYINGLFAPEDEALRLALVDARNSGLPEIQVSPGQGKFLYLLAKLMGARRILEIGTLAGYSTIWLARALPEGGRLVTLELLKAYADVATANIDRAGLSSKVELVVGPAFETLPLIMSRDTEPFDMVFIDADKVNSPIYFLLAMQFARSGTLILVDNIIRQGVVLNPPADDSNAVAARVFNEMISTDPRVEAIVLQQVGIKVHDGLAMVRVK